MRVKEVISMARKKQQRSQQGGMTVQEAGRKGGQATSHKYGEDFYEAIGSRGGNATKDRYGPEFYAKIGREGGQQNRGKRNSSR